ncbi:MAG: MotA/TolQ/ExbB proton channel family protein [Endomicrobiales bacterium]|jgi:biopolymer transport protein ExbB
MTEIFKKLALVGDVWVLWLLLAASVISLGVIFERWWVFQKNKLDFSEFLDKLAGFLEEGNLIGAKNIVENEQGIEARVARAGLENLFKGSASVEEAMISRLVLERSRLEKNLIVLGTLGNNAPFIGLFGTVLGIIKAFNDLAVSGSSGVSVVMAGISSALIATAFGILVAIPAVVANNAFQTNLKKKLANTQSLIHLMQIYLKDETGGRLCGAVKKQLEEEVRI